MKKRKSILLNTGDVIKTNPKSGYFGAAFVIDAQDYNDDFLPLCLIAVTDYISQTDFSFEHLLEQKFSILTSKRFVRIAPNDYREDGKMICIEIHTRKMNSELDVIGHVESFPFELPELTYKVGDGTRNGYPLCGPITSNLGYQAVVAWREINDRENFQSDLLQSRKRTEEIFREKTEAKNANPTDENRRL